MSFLERKVEFYGAPPEAEVLPLLLMRRSLYRWEAARAEAEWAGELQRAAPGDAALARCAVQAGRDVRAMAGIAARAVAAWAGDEGLPLTIRHAEGDATRLRVDAAFGPQGPALSEVPQGVGAPSMGGRTIDLVELEKGLIKRSIAAVVIDPEHKARAFEAVDRPCRVDPIGYSLGHGSDPWLIAYCMAYSTERLRHDGRPING